MNENTRVAELHQLARQDYAKGQQERAAIPSLFPSYAAGAHVPEPSDLDVAIRVAQQLLDSDQVLSLREALRLLLRALDAETDSGNFSRSGKVLSGSRNNPSDQRCPAAHPEDPTLDDAGRSLLAAIAEALDVPIPAQVDDLTATDLLRRRADEARIIAASVLPDMDARYIAGAAAQLRGWTAQSPVTYPTWQDRTTVDDDGQADEERARASVDRAFPTVAAFLATERGEQQ